MPYRRGAPLRCSGVSPGSKTRLEGTVPSLRADAHQLEEDRKVPVLMCRFGPRTAYLELNE